MKIDLDKHSTAVIKIKGPEFYPGPLSIKKWRAYFNLQSCVVTTSD
jgi:hypothetical protein